MQRGRALSVADFPDHFSLLRSLPLGDGKERHNKSGRKKQLHFKPRLPRFLVGFICILYVPVMRILSESQRTTNKRKVAEM
jgi:hypothetical protein